MNRTRELTPIEQLAIRQAGELRRTLEALKAHPPGDQADRECITDALSWLENVDRCLADIAIEDLPEDEWTDRRRHSP